jgi:hypothetical protein
MGAPLVEAQQYGSVLVADLSPVVMSRSRFGPGKERLVPLETAQYVIDPDDCPCALQCASLAAAACERNFSRGNCCRPTTGLHRPQAEARDSPLPGRSIEPTSHIVQVYRVLREEAQCRGDDGFGGILLHEMTSACDLDEGAA